MPMTDENQAGQSAEREYAHRRQARQARIKARYGTVGSIVAALAGEPRNVQAWRQGAEGEAATARALAIRLARSDVIVLHDRRVRGRSRANIDHIAIGPTGVTVIDTKSSRAASSSRPPASSTVASNCSSTDATAPASSTRYSSRWNASPASWCRTTPVMCRYSERCASRSCAASGCTTAGRATD